MYFVILVVGLVGYVFMAASGFLHGMGHHAGGHSGHAGHTGHGGHGHLGHGHAHHAGTQARLPHGKVHLSAKGSRPNSGTGLLLSTLSYLSPLSIFVFMVGMGACGMIASHLSLKTSTLVLIAITGGLLFNFGLFRPLMGLFLRFASNPIEGLEGAVAKEAIATTGFDTSGNGIVQLTLEGENVQLLASLDPAELHHGVRVNKGDKVIVLEVDAVRNRCRVTREVAGDLSPSLQESEIK